MLNFLGTIYREAPDAAAGAATTPPAAPPPVIDPANPPAAEGATAPAPSATEADPAATDPPAAATGKKPWYLDRISGESARAREAEAKAAEAIRRAEKFAELCLVSQYIAEYKLRTFAPEALACSRKDE